MTRIAVALGGNAMIRRGEPGSIEVQRHNLEVAARSLVDLAERSGAEIVLTHGNGPQVGFLAIQADMASAVVPPPPLDVLGACLLYTSPSPRDRTRSRMPSSA